MIRWMYDVKITDRYSSNKFRETRNNNDTVA